MMSSRLVALAILGAWSVSLQGCSEKKPEPKTSCSIKTSSVALAATKPCNKSIPSKTLETPDVVVKTMQDEKGFVEMQLQIGNNTFKTADRSSFASSPKNLTQVTLQPVQSTRKEAICVDLYSSMGIDSVIVSNDFSCPSCADAKATMIVWELVVVDSTFMSPGPCPTTERVDGENAEEGRHTESLKSTRPTQNISISQNVMVA